MYFCEVKHNISSDILLFGFGRITKGVEPKREEGSNKI